jgi:hypothetical protein
VTSITREPDTAGKAVNDAMEPLDEAAIDVRAIDGRLIPRT